MIYEAGPEADTAEIQYTALYNSVCHHLVEAMDNEAHEYASMLICVLYGGFAAQFPEGSPQRTYGAFRQFMRQVTQEINAPGVDEILHKTPHITPGWLPLTPA